ncbi:hypothetical protein GCM10007382_17510 [Salinibacterium xinjiangense]|nr:hypothetical protein GCM10007382_17510 [Salinibacterium xinjiangense]
MSGAGKKGRAQRDMLRWDDPEKRAIARMRATVSAVDVFATRVAEAYAGKCP